MSYYFPPWDTNLEPSDGNVRNWLDNLYAKFQPVEQARWNQANIDTLFHAGEQRFINSYFNFYPQYNWQNFNFNIVQQMNNMVTGYQRQHRKSIIYQPFESNHPTAADDWTKVEMYCNQYRQRLEKFSRACEESCISGFVLLQPYLDFRDDPINGTLDLKLWSYNSFLADPYFREPDASDANFFWMQQYISKQEAQLTFPDKIDTIKPMAGTPQRYGNFYFLPENYNMARNDLLVLSYVWYRWMRKKRMLINKITEELFDYGGTENELDELLDKVPELEEIKMDVPSWKLAVVLNDQLMFQGYNPLGFDECPVIPIYWNYDPQIAYYDLRVRSLTRAMRDPNFLLNRRIILNHDISESSINSGWKYKEDAISNPENLRYSGQGKDLIIKTGFEMGDAEKIIPNAVPPSDMQLADQMLDLIQRTSGISYENFGLSDDKAISGLTTALRQASSLVALQKYFDQWDTALKLLGNLDLKIIQNNWSSQKVAKILNKEPDPLFFNKMFTRHQVVVSEGLNTETQQKMHFVELLELNERMGGALPPSFIMKYYPGQGKEEITQFLESQAQQAQAAQQQKEMLENAFTDARLKELYSRAASNIAMARERHGRSESNIGLFEERLSEITQNRAMATKAKVESLEKLLDLIQKYGEIEAALKASQLQGIELQQQEEEAREKIDAKRTADANEFLSKISSQMPTQNISQAI
ncbi:MAG TPA: hypothetical protein VFX43_09355 [Chitinophagaceae bacterium]|nr:hypothetical protein [Chitinophagaceae bacterium]